MQSKDNSLNESEFNQLLRACKGIKDQILVVLMGGLGMRCSEVANTKKTWIDFDRNKISIPLSSDGWQVKTENSSRVIPFGSMPKAVAIISDYFAFYQGIKPKRIALYCRIKTIAKRTRIQKKVIPHTLRATAGYMFAEAGLSAQALRQIMGWAKLETAERYIIRSGRAAERELEENKEKLWL